MHVCFEVSVVYENTDITGLLTDGCVDNLINEGITISTITTIVTVQMTV